MRKLMASLVALVATTAANASPIISSPTGLTSPVTTLTFSEVVLPAGTVVTNQYSSYGVTFSGLYYASSHATGFNNSPPDLTNFPPVTNPVSILFNDPVTAAAFSLIGDFGTVGISSYRNGVLVESFTGPIGFGSGGSPNNYFGFQNSLFDRIDITFPNAAAIDNLQIGPAVVPEPISLVVFGGLIVGGAGVALRRRMTKAAA